MMIVDMTVLLHMYTKTNTLALPGAIMKQDMHIRNSVAIVL